MISPEARTALASHLEATYRQMEDDLIRNIAKQLTAHAELNGTVAWQIEQLTEMGMLNKKNAKAIAKYAGITDRQLQGILSEAGFKAVLSDETFYQWAMAKGADLIVPSPVAASPMMRQILDGAIANMRLELNLVNTTALESANDLFMRIVNQVYLETSTGTYTYDDSMRKAVRILGDQGIKGAHYVSARGRETFNQLDVAVRRAVLTSSAQTAAVMQMERAREWGANHVEVSSHYGARPSHAVWQGKVYMVDGSDREYANLAEATGYGTVTGLCGANCHHVFYPYIPGISSQRNFPVDMDENRTVYEQSQRQRAIERDIRAAKRGAVAADAAGDREGVARARRKLAAKQQDMSDFIDETGRYRRRNREQIVGYTRTLDDDARAAVRAYGAQPVA